MKIHWLDRPGAIRRVKIASAIVLVASVVAQLVVAVTAHFPMQAWFGFAAAFGFVACAAMVGVAKLISVFLERPDDYYEAGRD